MPASPWISQYIFIAGFKWYEMCSDYSCLFFFTRESLFSPHLGNICHSQTIWEWIFFLFLLQSPFFFFLAPFLFLAAHEEKAGWVGGEGNTPSNVAPWVVTLLIAPPGRRGVSEVLTSPFRAPAVWRKKSGRPPSRYFSQFGAIW